MSKTALIDAVKAFDVEKVQAILERKPALKTFQSEKGFNLLQMCCARLTDGDRAAAGRQLRLAKWLVANGFDPLVTHTTKPGEDGEEDPATLSLVFFAVARAQNNALARYFLEKGAGPKALFAAVWWGNWKILAISSGMAWTSTRSSGPRRCTWRSRSSIAVSKAGRSARAGG